jgi:hypothetical protein
MVVPAYSIMTKDGWKPLLISFSFEPLPAPLHPFRCFERFGYASFAEWLRGPG